MCVATPFCPERPAREPASKGHTGGGSRKNAKPAGPLLCTTVIKSDFCARTIQVVLRVVNKFNYNNVSRAGPTLKYFLRLDIQYLLFLEVRTAIIRS